MIDRCDEKPDISKAVETPIGTMPSAGAINTSGLNVTAETMEELLSVNPQEWLLDVRNSREFLSNFGDRLPSEMTRQLDALQQRLEHRK